MKKSSAIFKPSDRLNHGIKPEPTQKRPPAPPSRKVAKSVVNDEYKDGVKIDLPELKLSEYEMIVETLRLRRKQIHWSTDIDKEVTVHEFDLLIDKLTRLEK